MTSQDSLLDRAVRLLALRDHSEAELTRKLARYGGRAEVGEVIEALKARGYLDDEKFAHRRASFLRTVKLQGNKRIAQDLHGLGLSATIIRLVLERLEDEAPETVSLRDAVRTRVAKTGIPKNRNDVKRLFDYAVRQGYCPGAVREALAPFFSALGGEDVE